MSVLRGKCSWFGGPDDDGVAPDEPLAFIHDTADQPSLFLDQQPPDTTGLARRLDPEQFYLAMRWDYDETPRQMLLEEVALVRAIKTGIALTALPADWGPHQDTDRIADISPGLMDALGIETDDEVEIIFPYQGVEPMAEVVKCIDISHHQDFPDFQKVRAAGVIALVHKCSEGSSYVDPNRGKNCKNAIDAGIAVATYHWLSPGSSATQQMRFYLDTLQPVDGERVVIDYEEEGCTLDDLHEAVEALLADPRDLQITVYSGHLLKEQLNGNRDELLADNTDLWLAQYTSGTPSWSKGTYPEYTLWQYSESGTVNGISGSLVDLNRFNGSDDELLTWINPFGSVEPPQPAPPEMASVHLNLQTSGQVAISIAVNGEVIYGDA